MSDEAEKIDLRKVQRYTENPLITPSEIKTKQKTIRPFGTGHMVDTISGEIVTGTAVVVRQTIDEEHFVKVFAEGVKAAYDLTPSGYKVFQIVLKTVQAAAVGTDSIYLHFMDAAQDKDFPISDKTFWKGMKELLSKQFIASAAYQNKYWINPHLFFKGDRVAFVKEYVKRKTVEDKRPNRKASPTAEPVRDPNTIDIFNGKADAET